MAPTQKNLILSRNRSFKYHVYKLVGVMQPASEEEKRTLIADAIQWQTLLYNTLSTYQDKIVLTIKYVHEPQKEHIAIFLIIQYKTKGATRIENEPALLHILHNLFLGGNKRIHHPYLFEKLPPEKARVVVAMRKNYRYASLKSINVDKSTKIGYKSGTRKNSGELLGRQMYRVNYFSFLSTLQLLDHPQEVFIHLRPENTYEPANDSPLPNEESNTHHAQPGPYLRTLIWTGYPEKGNVEGLSENMLRQHFSLQPLALLQPIQVSDLDMLLADEFDEAENQGNNMTVAPGEYPWFVFLPMPEVKPSGLIYSIKGAADKKPTTTGVTIGYRAYGRKQVPVMLSDADLTQHLYAIGQTGVGKTTFIKGIIKEIMQKGQGFAIIDPHGDLIDSIDQMLTPALRRKCVMIDVGRADSARFNILDYDRSHPEQASFLINSLLEIINTQYDMRTVGGPMFERYFVNAMKLVLEQPAPSFEILTRLFEDVTYLRELLAKTKNLDVKMHFSNALQASGDQSFPNFGPYIISKVTRIMDDQMVYHILSAKTGGLQFRHLMDNGKIILVNLRQGLISRESASFLGSAILQKLIYAAKSRHNTAPDTRRAFTVFVDEFQNFVQSEVEYALAEVRKYNLRFVLANQNLNQLDAKMAHAILGNIASTVFFRVGVMDAQTLEPYVAPYFSKEDLMYLKNFEAIAKLLQHKEPQKPFILQAYPL